MNTWKKDTNLQSKDSTKCIWNFVIYTRVFTICCKMLQIYMRIICYAEEVCYITQARDKDMKVRSLKKMLHHAYQQKFPVMYNYAYKISVNTQLGWSGESFFIWKHVQLEKRAYIHYMSTKTGDALDE